MPMPVPVSVPVYLCLRLRYRIFTQICVYSHQWIVQKCTVEGTAPAPRLGHTASVICIAGHLHLVVFGGRSLPHFTTLSRQLECYCLLLSFILHHRMSCVLA